MVPTNDPLSVDDGDLALSGAECRQLLASESIGRVGLTSRGLPCILPVCFLFHDETVLFRTGTGSKLRAAESGDVLAFEVDRFDLETGEGWSVLVLGRATVHDRDHREVPEIAAALAAGSGRDHLVTLRCEIVTGRAVQLAV